MPDDLSFSDRKADPNTVISVDEYREWLIDLHGSDFARENPILIRKLTQVLWETDFFFNKMQALKDAEPYVGHNQKGGLLASPEYQEFLDSKEGFNRAVSLFSTLLEAVKKRVPKADQKEKTRLGSDLDDLPAISTVTPRPL